MLVSSYQIMFPVTGFPSWNYVLAFNSTIRSEYLVINRSGTHILQLQE